jgi:hypothetical protein
MTLPYADEQAMLLMPTDEQPPVGIVRCWVLVALTGVPLLPKLHVDLVAEELVVNARRHAEPPYVLRLVLDESHRAVLVCVDDCSPESPDRSGAGLLVVDGLSTAWGVERRASAKTVWAEVPLGMRASRLVIPPQP